MQTDITPTIIAAELNDGTLVDGSEHPVYLIRVRYGDVVDVDRSHDTRIVLRTHPNTSVMWNAERGRWDVAT